MKKETLKDKKAFRETISHSEYIKLVNIKRENPKFKGFSSETLYFHLERNDEWKNYSNAGFDLRTLDEQDKFIKDHSYNIFFKAWNIREENPIFHFKTVPEVYAELKASGEWDKFDYKADRWDDLELKLGSEIFSKLRNIRSENPNMRYKTIETTYSLLVKSGEWNDYDQSGKKKV